MTELTDKHLGIARAWARKFGRGDPLLIDELESEGMLYLGIGALSFEEGKGASLTTWLTTHVKHACTNYLKKHDAEKRGGGKRPMSLDKEMFSDSNRSLLDLIGSKAERVTYDYEDCISCLSDFEIACLHMVDVNGLTYHQAGEVVGKSKSTICNTLRKAKEKIKRSRRTKEAHEAGKYKANGTTQLKEWRRLNEEEAHAQMCASIKKAQAERRRSAIYRQARGGVKIGGWYLLDEQERNGYGDFASIHEAYLKIGISVRPMYGFCNIPWFPAIQGWPLIAKAEAKVLLAILNGAEKKQDLTKAASLKNGDTELRRLKKRGYVTSLNGSYKLTDLCLLERGLVTHLVPCSGKEMKRRKEEDHFTVLPAKVTPMAKMISP